jgi:hypothetical protein
MLKLIKKTIKDLDGWLVKENEANFPTEQTAIDFVKFCDSKDIKTGIISTGYKRWFVLFES